MNRNFEDRKSTKPRIHSKENKAIIKALNMYGRVPEQWELLEEIEKLNNIIDEFENRDDVLKEFEDWLERQKTRNSEWDNFIMVDGRLGIPISYLLNKLQKLKGDDKE